MKPALRSQVGLLALTSELYETLAPGLRSSRETWIRQVLIPALRPYADVHFDGAVFLREEIEAAVDGFEAEDLDAILVVLLTDAPSQLALPALQRTRLPIVIWNTQELAAVDTSFTAAARLANQGVRGTQDLANVLTRCGVGFHYVTSTPNDPRGLLELDDFAAAATAVRRLRSARIGMLGYPVPGAGDLAVDTTHLVSTLGCSWLCLTPEECVRRAATADAADVAELVTEYREGYAVAPAVTDADLEATARGELALRSLVNDLRLDALTCQSPALGEDPRPATLPSVAVSRLMADGLGFAGAGDLTTAAATAFLNWLKPPASGSEISTIDFAGGGLFLSHQAEANVGMARRDRRVPLVVLPASSPPARDRQLALVTTLEPGPATLAALTLGPGARWRWIAAPATVVEFGPLPDLPTPHCKLRPEGDVRDFLTAYAGAGGPRHHVVCFGDARRRLRLAAAMLGADYLEL